MQEKISHFGFFYNTSLRVKRSNPRNRSRSGLYSRSYSNHRDRHATLAMTVFLCHPEVYRRIAWKGKTCGLNIIRNMQSAKYPLPGVCSPVEAGEVARVACRRGGDLPRGLRQRLRMTVNKHVIAREHSDRGNPRNRSRSGLYARQE